jgi:hypothetical protein
MAGTPPCRIWRWLGLSGGTPGGAQIACYARPRYLPVPMDPAGPGNVVGSACSEMSSRWGAAPGGILPGWGFVPGAAAAPALSGWHRGSEEGVLYEFYVVLGLTWWWAVSEAGAARVFAE